MKYQQNNKENYLQKGTLLLYHTITKSWFKNPQPCYIIVKKNVRIPFEKKSQCYVHNQISYNEKQVEKCERVSERYTEYENKVEKADQVLFSHPTVDVVALKENNV